MLDWEVVVDHDLVIVEDGVSFDGVEVGVGVVLIFGFGE